MHDYEGACPQGKKEAKTAEVGVGSDFDDLGDLESVTSDSETEEDAEDLYVYGVNMGGRRNKKWKREGKKVIHSRAFRNHFNRSINQTLT